MLNTSRYVLAVMNNGGQFLYMYLYLWFLKYDFSHSIIFSWLHQISILIDTEILYIYEWLVLLNVLFNSLHFQLASVHVGAWRQDQTSLYKLHPSLYRRHSHARVSFPFVMDPSFAGLGLLPRFDLLFHAPDVPNTELWGPERLVHRLKR